MNSGQACRPCRRLCSPILGRGCSGDLLGDEIIVSPPSPIVEPLSVPCIKTGKHFNYERFSYSKQAQKTLRPLVLWFLPLEYGVNNNGYAPRCSSPRLICFSLPSFMTVPMKSYTLEPHIFEWWNVTHLSILHGTGVSSNQQNVYDLQAPS